MYYRTLTVCLQPYIPAWLIIPCISMHYLFAHQCSNILTCRIVESSCFLYLNWVTLLRTLPHVRMKRNRCIWGENRGKWKGRKPPGIEPRTPLACAASTVPLSHDNQTTTSPHYFVYSLLVHVHIQVSYSSACLSDALQQLPEHFCMLPSKEYLIAGIAGLITYFQWKKVLVISQEYSTFAFVSAALS